MKAWTNVGIPIALKKEIKAVADQIGCTMSTIATKAINQYLDDSVEDIIEKMKNDDEIHRYL